MRKAKENELNKSFNKKLLRDKFGFSDDEEDDIQNQQNSKKSIPIYSAQAV